MDAKLICHLILLEASGFNPRARDGREGIVTDRRAQGCVSIHAPVMDANIPE